ncbi:hypothetical protein [Paraliobacillus ryukyuensis]|uniref:hypothetical protein n=1 Tax=Paraliobacillus ryukyuensis TaxID=200904 RepID=UPI0009A596AA|nr:hypothetical protein [Paraliobacillus ryukyuensis]
MRYVLVLVASIFIVLVGCSNDLQEKNNVNSSSSGGETGSYASLLKVNGVQYTPLGNFNEGKYTIDKEIGNGFISRIKGGRDRVVNV